MSQQTKKMSLVESCLNVGSGFVISMFLWQCILAPWFGYNISIADNVQLTSVFTGVSVARGYLWRRFFTNRFKEYV